MTVSKFLLTGLCPGTDTTGPRAQKALAHSNLFPLIVEVRLVDPDVCPNCAAKRYKLSTESQVRVERIFNLRSDKTRRVCESMGSLIR